MSFSNITFKEANRYLPQIALVGIALGMGNYALGIWETLGQSLIQQLAISFVIGYLLLLIAFNFPIRLESDLSKKTEYLALITLFTLVGIVGTECDILVRNIFFKEVNIQFLNFGGVHVFNIFLTNVLGFATQNFVRSIPEEKNIENPEIANEPLSAIPIKKGEAIVLHPLDEVIFFEAYDNYSFLHDLSGNKFLCNYSLIFLEKKLGKNFLRIHRKHLINRELISQIKPHFKQRFIIEFKDSKKTSVTSGAAYSKEVKSIFKL